MKKIVYKTEADEQLHNAVKATPTHWFEMTLPDSALRPQFNRKIKLIFRMVESVN